MSNKQIFLSLLLILLGFSTVHAQLNEGKPMFQGPTIIGHKPNTPFSLYVPHTGQKPIKLKAVNLPLGWTFDEKTNIIDGQAGESGKYEFTVLAENAQGITERKYTIELGDKLCLTPPLGWNSWNVFTTDISEQMLIEIADAMVNTGMRDLGYQYINIDDFWHADARDEKGKPVVDPKKFPHGMKFLADYVHSKGLKLGIYSCAGKMTCGERFGGYEHEEIDAQTYAEWGIDLLKYDYCYAPLSKSKAIERYKAMGTALQKTNRTIVFSICEWGLRKPWKWGRSVHGSYWRITPDIFDVWQKPAIWMYSVMGIVNRSEKVQSYAGPGGWNDMDMLLVGNYGMGKATSAKGLFKGLNDIEYKSHMSLWAMLASPLLSSCDLRTMNEPTKSILMNPLLLSIHQDSKGKQAILRTKKNKMRIYTKELEDGFALAILNTSNKNSVFTLDDLKKMGITESEDMTNIWTNEKMKSFANSKLELKPHETLVLKIKQTK